MNIMRTEKNKNSDKAKELMGALKKFRDNRF
jgi:hypothetical protein